MVYRYDYRKTLRDKDIYIKQEGHKREKERDVKIYKVRQRERHIEKHTKDRDKIRQKQRKTLRH